MEILSFFLFIVGNIEINRLIQKKPEKQKDNGKRIIDEKTFFYKNYSLFLKSFEQKENQEINKSKYSENIENFFYNKQEFSSMLVDEKNIVEKLWKTRILYESTPRGNIAMYYDVYKQGFAYYSDQSFVPYNLLNAVAMKYVLNYRCRHFFIDEIALEMEKYPERLSPLVEIFDEKPEKKELIKTTVKNTEIKIDDFNPFAKLKNYKMTDTMKPQTTKNAKPVGEPLKLVVKNRFVNKGKIRDFVILNKPEKKMVKNTIKTGYNGLFSSGSQSGGENNRNSFKTGGFSYKDFKENKDKLMNNKI
jgi:hypothetical protein